MTFEITVAKGDNAHGEYFILLQTIYELHSLVFIHGNFPYFGLSVFNDVCGKGLEITD